MLLDSNLKTKKIKRSCVLIYICLFVSGCSILSLTDGAPEVHVIGVYQGAYPKGTKPGFGKHPDGIVEVIIQENNKPIVLILESHEPVIWTLINPDNTRIRKVVLSSPYVREVSGLDTQVKVEYERIGFFGYKKEFAYKKVEKYSINKFGISPESLQTEYKGSQFVIQ